MQFNSTKKKKSKQRNNESNRSIMRDKSDNPIEL